MTAPAHSGIYAITHAATGRLYVGSSCNVSRRWSSHKGGLNRGDHANPILQAGWNKHGAEAYAFSVVEAVADVADLIAREQHWIGTLDPHYNIRKVAESNLGLVHSAETRQRMSVAGKARPSFSAETRRRMSASNKARPPASAETRQKMSALRRGKKLGPQSAETRAKISVAATGRRPSDETRQKMSLAAKARTDRAKKEAA